MVIPSDFVAEVTECLTENILPFWLRLMPDRERGGWYGRMLSDGTIVPDAPRSSVLYARMLWAFSAAYRVLADEEYRQAALRTYDYILLHFLDPHHGGTFWMVDAEGRPQQRKKQMYAQGFMLYGLSEYHRATGSEEALRQAIALYRILERYARDPLTGGYIEACSADWLPLPDMRLSPRDANYPLSQNTHLHILEPYTNLYRVWPDAGLRESIEALIGVFQHHIINPLTGHLGMFFQADWTPIAERWESYGHDIECSWLMHEAALVLGDADLLRRTEPTVRRLAEVAAEGLQADGSMAHELHGATADTDRHWWVQAEAVVGYLNMHQHFGEADALPRVQRLWAYIQEHLVDRHLGEWHWSVTADGCVNMQEDHAGPWKCPYHNTRMCLEVIERSRSGEILKE